MLSLRLDWPCKLLEPCAVVLRIFAGDVADLADDKCAVNPTIDARTPPAIPSRLAIMKSACPRRFTLCQLLSRRKPPSPLLSSHGPSPTSLT